MQNQANLTNWQLLLGNYTSDQAFIEKTWQEIFDKYSGKKRFYHNLSHINALLEQADHYRSYINDLDVLQFAIWYHDVIYNPGAKDNELKSADFMETRLSSTALEQHRIQKCKEMIIGSKTHLVADGDDDNDLKFFFDFDFIDFRAKLFLVYENYAHSIRKEFKIYPNFIYNKGRKQALTSFLNRERIYYTKVFYNNYEMQARINIEREISKL